ncbi:MAG: sugar phosphate isomerase/epimerase family protein [Candidatus Woesearchaeota archaeon]|nr:sugar phosphate isomerase/epimerase family protein [Candidatus Woesearchaeota archaeon]
MYEIGVMTSSLGIENPIEAVKKAKELGFTKVQLTGLTAIDEQLPHSYLSSSKAELADFLKTNDMRVSSLSLKYCKGEDPRRWLWRANEYIKFASEMNVGLVTGHIGKIESGASRQLAHQMKKTASYCKDKNVYFGIETGTESPWDLIGFICSVEGRDTDPRIVINFDPANFLIYGTLEADEILDSIPMFKSMIGQVHVKDAVPGKEVSLGEGSVNIKDYILALQKIGYNGPLVLETGGAQAEKLAKIKNGKIFLENILKEIELNR